MEFDMSDMVLVTDAYKARISYLEQQLATATQRADAAEARLVEVEGAIKYLGDSWVIKFLTCESDNNGFMDVVIYEGLLRQSEELARQNVREQSFVDALLAAVKSLRGER